MIRVHLSGQLTLEVGATRFHGPDFPGRQGREAFAFLVMKAGMPVGRDAVLDALWSSDPPESAGASLNSILSKLRRLLTNAGVDGVHALRFVSGCYELHLPAGTWIDHTVAFDALHRAEIALRKGDIRTAYGPSAVARQIAGRPFLPGSDADWVEARRTRLRRTLVRALECRSEVYRRNGEFGLAADAAHEASTVEPLRESTYRLLMEAHAGAGNTAEALAVYERCRTVIADALGVAPSAQTKRVRERIIDGL